MTDGFSMEYESLTRATVTLAQEVRSFNEYVRSLPEPTTVSRLERQLTRQRWALALTIALLPILTVGLAVAHQYNCVLHGPDSTLASSICSIIPGDYPPGGLDARDSKRQLEETIRLARLEAKLDTILERQAQQQ